MQNASMAFDPATLTPTYQLTVGLPGGSNAMATAARLGIPEEIINNARSVLSGASQELEDLLANLMAEKQKIAALQQELQAERDEFARRNAALGAELQRIKTEERQAIREARDAIVRETAELHREIRQATAELRKQKNREGIEQARRTLAGVRQQLAGEVWQPPASEDSGPVDGSIRAGDTVRIRDIGLTATVLSVSEEAQEIEVQAGRSKMTLGLEGARRKRL
jgi:DNA mismatch repair protein MutS2